MSGFPRTQIIQNIPIIPIIPITQIIPNTPITTDNIRHNT